MKLINRPALFSKLLPCAALMMLSAPSSDAAQAIDEGGPYDFDLRNIGSTAAIGSYLDTIYMTNEAPAPVPERFANSQNTGHQADSLNNMGALNLPVTGLMPLDKVFGGKKLPPTRLDSFVRCAGASADQIYGDEGADGLPPFFGFDSEHRIEKGIRCEQLTTGHKSDLPEAWGWPQ